MPWCSPTSYSLIAMSHHLQIGKQKPQACFIYYEHYSTIRSRLNSRRTSALKEGGQAFIAVYLVYALPHRAVASLCLTCHCKPADLKSLLDDVKRLREKMARERWHKKSRKQMRNDETNGRQRRRKPEREKSENVLRLRIRSFVMAFGWHEKKRGEGVNNRRRRAMRKKEHKTNERVDSRERRKRWQNGARRRARNREKSGDQRTNE